MVSLAFTAAPDQTGSGPFTVDVTGLTDSTTQVGIYGLPSENNSTAELLLASPPLVPPAQQYSSPAPTPAVPYSAFIAISGDGSPPQSVALSDLTSLGGESAWTVYPVYVPPDEAEGILNAAAQFAELIQTGTLKRATGQIPTPQEAIAELEDLGVPTSYFTPDVQTNLGTALNELQTDEHGRVSPKAGGWSCWTCRVGFAIAICAVVVAIALAIFLAVTTSGGSIVVPLYACLQACSLAAISTNAGVLATGLSALAWVGGTSTICTALASTLPNLICKATGNCD